MSTKFIPSVFSISRQDQERVITITSAASKNTNGTLIKQEFDSKTKDYKLPT
ncbi:MAG: hypothetical protein LBU14_00035 [Candidatus Peribacteria bacterium]|jgi:hypothetical protein|nr:hypothetical protein [Candidatus Peribacteria bacterium]